MLRDFIALPTVLVDIVVDYAQPFIVAILDTDYSSYSESIFESLLPVIDAVLLTSGCQSQISQVTHLCTMAQVPCKMAGFGVSDPERVRQLETNWGTPDFILCMQNYYTGLYSIKLHPGWREQLVFLDLDRWHSIWNGSALALYPVDVYLRASWRRCLYDSDDDNSPANYDDDDVNGDDDKKHMPRGSQPLPFVCVSWQTELGNILAKQSSLANKSL